MESCTDIIEQFKNQLHHIFSNLGNHNKELSDLKKTSCDVDVQLSSLTVKQEDLNNEILRLRQEIQLKNEEYQAISTKVIKCNEIKVQNDATIELVKSKIQNFEAHKNSLKVKIHNEFQRQIAELKKRFAPFANLYKKSPIAAVENADAQQFERSMAMVEYATSPQTSSSNQIPIPYKHLETMDPEQKLDDVAILYLLREEIKGKEAEFFVADTNCYPLKLNGNYKSCCKYFMRNECAKVFIPINLRPGTECSHWTLIFLNKTSKQMNYYDSLHGSGGEILREFNTMFKDYMQSKRQCIGKFRDFTMLDTPDKHPYQTMNDYDCGFHVIMTARKIAQDEPITYSEEAVNALRHMARYRAVMGHDAVSLEAALNLNWRTVTFRTDDDKKEQSSETRGRQKRLCDATALQDQDSTPKRQKH